MILTSILSFLSLYVITFIQNALKANDKDTLNTYELRARNNTEMYYYLIQKDSNSIETMKNLSMFTDLIQNDSILFYNVHYTMSGKVVSIVCN